MALSNQSLSVYLDTLQPLELSTRGNVLCRSTGYRRSLVETDIENHLLPVLDVRHEHALATWAPSRVAYNVGAGYEMFHTEILVPPGAVADFRVLVDGQLAAAAVGVRDDGHPKILSVNLRGVRTLELVTSSDSCPGACAIWAEPKLSLEEPFVLQGFTGRVRATVPAELPHTPAAVATVINNGFGPMLANMLASLRQNAGIGNVPVYVFGVDLDEATLSVIDEAGAVHIPCQAEAGLTLPLKTILYSAARIIPANTFLCLDADVLILGELNAIFDALAVGAESVLFAACEANVSRQQAPSQTLASAMRDIYEGRPGDCALLGLTRGDERYPYVLNAGVFAGTRLALLELDSALRHLVPHALQWDRNGRDTCQWREQFLFNLCIARLGSLSLLADTYNVQLLHHDVDLVHFNGRGCTEARFRGSPIKIVHFNGRPGKRKYPALCRSLGYGV